MSTETKGRSISGWGMLLATIALFLLDAYLFVKFAACMSVADETGAVVTPDVILALPLAIVVLVLAIILCNGFFSLQPGQARVCVLFGKYEGTVREEGFRWGNPFYSKSLGEDHDATAIEGDGDGAKRKGRHSGSNGSVVSVRARTLNGERLKVNDKMGNPIEIATVVVWHVADTAKAVFDVDDYESFVSMQTETALRHVASVYAYDHMEDDDASNASITLRSNIEEVSESLRAELDRRLSPAGVDVDDARLTHLAYAPEIAQAMLRRQQAEAVIAARKKIVEGAVSMVDMALTKLAADDIVEFDNERKAVMASNLMVVLCGESDAQPVLNTGSLYQ